MSCEAATWAIAETLASGAAQQIGAADRTEVIGGSSRLRAAADLNRYTAPATGKGMFQGYLLRV